MVDKYEITVFPAVTSLEIKPKEKKEWYYRPVLSQIIEKQVMFAILDTPVVTFKKKQN